MLTQKAEIPQKFSPQSLPPRRPGRQSQSALLTRNY
jgi:hypothetical protein